MGEEIRQAMRTSLHAAQAEICAALAALDGGAQFEAHDWARAEGGGGWSRVLQGGRIFDKAGVNVSEVHGELTPQAARSMGGGEGLGPEDDLSFYATGLSLIVHPKNPMAPTVHANYRYFERGTGAEPAAWWFGGGADLTPSYLFDDDVRHFHATHKAACDAHDEAFYPRFKAWADTYFHIPHRKECRGVGGIFFDNLNDRPKGRVFAFVQDCLAAFLPAYLPIIERRAGLPYAEDHLNWQQLRRGRYVEFNLVYDRGTTFGLRTGGRIESILVSLPLHARWEYDPPEPAPDSAEGRLLEAVRRPRDWA